MSAASKWALAALVTVGLVELGLRVALSQHDFRQTLTRGGQAGLRLANLESATWMDPSVLTTVPIAHDALLGWTMRPGHASDRPPNVVHLNAQGARHPVDVPPDSTFAGQRVVVLGDSFAFGADVPDDDTFVARLQRADRQVLNLAVIGYGHDQMLLRNERDALPYRPDVVVLVLVGCDLYRNLEDFTAWHKPRFELQGSALVQVGWPPASFEAALSQHQWRPRLLDALEVYREALHPVLRVPPAHRPVAPATEALAVALLSRAAEQARAHDAVPVLLVAPLPGAEWSSLDRLRAEPVYRVYEALCRDEGIVCADAAERMQPAAARGVPMQATGQAHWSPEAHTLVAETLDPVLSELAAR
jgi:hypothetical protein